MAPRRHTPDDLDQGILHVLADHERPRPTFDIRDGIRKRDAERWSHLTSGHVMTGCLRLQANWLIREAHTIYATQKSWEITKAGRAYIGRRR